MPGDMSMDNFRFTAADEAEYVARSSDAVRARQCVAYAQAMNLLDAGSVAGLLADDVRYESQSVFDSICGRAEVVNHIGGKFETLQECGEDCLVRIELALEQDGTPCLIVHQRESSYGRSGLGRRVGCVLLTPGNSGQIQAILMASVTPTPDDCLPTGIFPGITSERLARERGHTGKRLNRASTRLVVFVLPGLAGNEQVVANVKEAARILGIESVRALGALEKSADESDISGVWEQFAEEARRHGIVGFPTLCVFDGDTLVRRIVGAHTVESFCVVMGDLFGQ
jgi:hypothetical protein